MTKIRNWVFDLDDTLYNENDYVRSALRFVGKQIDQKYLQSGTSDQLITLYQTGNSDPISTIWTRYRLPLSELEQILQAMRSHKPEISLSTGAKKVLSHLRANRQPFAIVTDGRSITQRAKVEALGCTDAAFISISEETGFTKMDAERFIAISEVFPSGQFCYVGDNPSKDFFMPRHLGWKTFMIDHHGFGVHPQELPADVSYHPDQIISDLAQLLHYM